MRADKGHQREDVGHYKTVCTPYCVGGNTDVAILPNGGNTTIDMFRRVREEMARNSNSTMNTAIATAASSVSRMQGRQNLGGGACRCKGGPANCPGCEEKPVYRTFSKPGGRDGAAGASGPQRLESLFAGDSGEDGRVEITVRHANGDRPKYNSAFNLELVGFDVEDENADGIVSHSFPVCWVAVILTGRMPRI